MAKLPSASNRLISLDVFRGLTIAAMILVNNADGGTITQLKHAQWNGWTFADTIFPSFLWICGVAIVFSLLKRTTRSTEKRVFFLHLIKRSIILFVLGLFLNAFPAFQIAILRIPGVLQRIAICYVIAGSILLYSNTEGIIASVVLLLGTYWIFMKTFPVPGYGKGNLALQGNFAQYIDVMFLRGHLLTEAWDPEGIVSTIPAIATMLFGVLVGKILVTSAAIEKKAAYILLMGSGLIIAGLIMNLWLPINKNLWTSSFAVFMAGLASVVFSLLYIVIDVKGYKKWTGVFVIFGMNSIIVYALSGFLSKIVWMLTYQGIPIGSYIYQGISRISFGDANIIILYSIAHVVVVFSIAYALYKKKLFLKI